jgi:hypothetical protein
MPSIKKHALLFYGSEISMREESEGLCRYLQDIGCETELISILDSPLEKLKQTISSLSKRDVLLLVFSAHGNVNRWEGGILHKEFAKMLKGSTCKLVVINESCYGKTLLQELKKVRRPSNTSLLTQWVADGLVYGRLIKDIERAWSSARCVDEMIVGICELKDGRIVERPLLFRWGVDTLETLFFERELPVQLMRADTDRYVSVHA